MKIEAALTYDKIRHDQDRDAHLVISLTAPAKEGEARAPICVVPVVDVSGSMSGDKLEYAKRSAIKLIEHLRPGDYTGLVAFESCVHVIIPPQKITAQVKDKMKAEVGKLHVMGGTNFAGGMLKAIELINALDLPEGVIHRIIMLTDGQANEGPATKKEALIKLFQANSGRVTASAFGYGNDVDQDLLGDFATASKGNYAYIKDPDGALTAFGKELGGLVSTYATDLVVELSPLAGHEIVSVVSDVDADEEDVGGEVTINLPEILAEERRDLVLAVKLKGQKQAPPRPVNLFDVKLSFDTISSDGKKEKQTAEAKAKAQFVKPGEENPKPNPDLDKIVALAEVVRAQIEAEEKAKKGDYTAAAAVMDYAAGNVRSRGYVALAAAAGHTSATVGSHANYNAGRGYLRSMRSGGTRGMGVSEVEPEAAMYLADAGVNLSNSAQTATSNAFSGGSVLVENGTLNLVPGAVNPVGGILTPGTSTVVGLQAGADLAAMMADPGPSWVVPNPAAPPVPQTNNTPAKDAAPAKPAKKAGLKKNKSSARW